ncbi:quinolinate synthase NadA [Methylohalobius crimeensis]|uniref:quinolinate synthase NadA n=1 Tax=Methylohalobius crimeensis TaxID=244365 RepID=UPI0003B75EEB|nr:quinolinate synthase NadA [Methylohalobius crimeensis]
MPSSLEFTPQVKAATQPIYERLRDVIPEMEWPVHAPLIARINELKRERSATLVAHNYQLPEIFHGIADYTGDSLGMAKFGAETEADVIVVCGVRFMAESAKMLSPEKTVLLPDMEAGCSLAASITAQDVRRMREKYPGVPVVTYVNTYADVRAEADICCTSVNAVQVVESLGTDRVIFIPDGYLGRYVATQTDVEIILWEGACEVHERFTGEELRHYRRSYPDIQVIAHPECPPDVLEEADFVGSTSGMIRYIDEHRPERVVMITECTMSDNVAVEFPRTNFVRPCNLCPHMRRITLPKILHSLETLQPEVHINPETARQAHRSLERMLAV